MLFDCNYHDWFADSSKTWTGLPVRCNAISSGKGSGLTSELGCSNAYQFCANPPAEILYNFDEDLTHPGKNTVVSFLCRTDERENVEVGLCGNEGVIGADALFGVETAAHQNLVQVPGTGLRLDASAASAEFRRGGRFQELILRFTHSLFIQVSQTALCNRLHSDEERLARWLLLSHDRANSQQLPLPRELLAKLLGRSLSAAGLTASLLESAGLIGYNGAELIITNREKLETVACSCYWVARRQAAKVLEASGMNS